MICGYLVNSDLAPQVTSNTNANSAKQRNKNFSWGDMPDTEFVDSLFVEAWTFFQKVQSMFSDNKESENTEKAHKKDISETVGGGLFSGSATTGKRD